MMIAVIVKAASLDDKEPTYVYNKLIESMKTSLEKYMPSRFLDCDGVVTFSVVGMTGLRIQGIHKCRLFGSRGWV